MALSFTCSGTAIAPVTKLLLGRRRRRLGSQAQPGGDGDLDVDGG